MSNKELILDNNLELEGSFEYEKKGREWCRYVMSWGLENVREILLADRQLTRSERRKAVTDKSRQPRPQRQQGNVNESRNVLLDAPKEAAGRFKHNVLRVASEITRASTRLNTSPSIAGPLPLKQAAIILL